MEKVIGINSKVLRSILVTLRENHGIDAADVAIFVGMERQTVRRHLRTLEKLGIVKRPPNLNDMHLKYNYLTKLGEQYLTDLETS